MHKLHYTRGNRTQGFILTIADGTTSSNTSERSEDRGSGGSAPRNILAQAECLFPNTEMVDHSLRWPVQVLYAYKITTAQRKGQRQLTPKSTPGCFRSLPFVSPRGPYPIMPIPSSQHRHHATAAGAPGDHRTGGGRHGPSSRAAAGRLGPRSRRQQRRARFRSSH